MSRTLPELPTKGSTAAARILVFSLALVATVTTLAVAQEPAPTPRAMTILDLIDMPAIGDAVLSPDGASVVYVRSESDWKKNRRVSHLWRVARGGSGSIQLTFGDKGESDPTWAPDGRAIAFLAERDGDKTDQVYLLPTAGGEARRLFVHPTSPASLAFSPDGAFLYFLAADEKTKEQKERAEAKDDVFAFDEEYQQRHLWRVAMAEPATGERKAQKITAGDSSVSRYRLSRDGARLLFHRAPSPRFDDSAQSEVWIAAADASDPRRLTDNAVGESGASLSPDGKSVLFVAGANDRFESYYNDNLFTVPAAGGAPTLLLPEMPYEVGQAEWSQDGQAIVFTASTGVRVELFRYRLADQRLEPMTRGDHTVRGWHYSATRDEHLFAIDRADNAGDLWLLAGAGEPARVTTVYDRYAAEYRLPRQERVEWKGADGVAVEGLLYYPLDYQPGNRYPLVVQTHGGPASADTFGFGRWSSYTAVLAARGWMVLKPNYRGSTGYGDEFLRDMVGHYFRQAHLDVIAGVDALIERGLVDPQRMVKMGWSAGGHMTNKIITVTDRFKAASSGAGAVNWISMYAQSDVRIYRTPWFGGTPWQEDAPIDLYWGQSPLKDIARVKTPTLILVGENDLRVPMPQSVELYRALQSNGVETRLYVAPREPHGWRELRHQLFKVNVELEWFERLALGREYVWEKAPGAVEKTEKAEVVESSR